MKYKEYLAGMDSLDRRLGVLGEVHCYNREDSRFAKEIVPCFDTVAYEGSSKNSSIAWICALYAPALLAYMFGTNRLSSDTAYKIAEKSGKRLFRLEEDEEQLFPLAQKIALAIDGLISIPMAPFYYMHCKKHGDPYVIGTNAYEKRIAKEKKGKKSLSSRLTNYAFMNNLEERDKVMAERSADIFQGFPGDLLVVCGEKHLDGIVENLHQKLELKEVRSFP